MYKRTKGQSKTKTSSATNNESVDRVLELMDTSAAAMSLVASPRTRVSELKAIFKAEYPLLDFDAHDTASRTRTASPSFVVQVLRYEDEAEREERHKQDDGVEGPLEFTAERAQVQRVRAGVELEEDGVGGLRFDEETAEQRQRDDVGELRACGVPEHGAGCGVERGHAGVG